MSENMMQKDLVLSINEYAYVLDRTKGNVLCHVGPTKTSLSQSDELVRFEPKSKKFRPCGYNEAISLFASAPENWYLVLKNPTKSGRHPTAGTSNNLPEDIEIGRKINIPGPVSFALYPGQMAKVVKGHALRTNQYLLARVYDAASASAEGGQVIDADGNVVVPEKKDYVNGQILVIKGTDISFYIPPTGIEVIPLQNDDALGYIRDAVTLERLEYCILKDEDGNKRYVHGPEVVFPEPTESFVTSPKGGFIFRAIELSKISGIYVKVIAEYADDDGTVHPVGEELFITGDDQMIYYPRPEHAIINYDEKILHHAIAIPDGEGIYVMNRMNGEIKTVRGPAMYLPDPRVEVVVKRKLSQRECNLWYPGNQTALAYNAGLTEKSLEKAIAKSVKAATANLDSSTATAYSVTNSVSNINREFQTLAYLESNAGISRGTSYTKPRTITLDNKYDGVVSLDVWTGYAVNVVSKNGTRKVVRGPQTILLDYDQTLEELQLSTGNPKTTDKVEHTVFLRYENNKVSDIISVETKDFVECSVKVSYCVDFDPAYMDSWFSVDNYVKYLCDRIRSLLKREVKKHTIEDFYQNYSDIVRNIAIDYSENTTSEKASNKHEGRFFRENGMFVKDCEVLSLTVESEIAEILERHQRDMVEKSLELSDAEARVKVAEALFDAEKKENELASTKLINRMNLQGEEARRKLEIQAEVNRKQEAEKQAAKQAEKDMQVLIDAIHEAEMARKQKEIDANIAEKKALADIEKAKQEAYAKTVADVMKSIQPDLVAAIQAQSDSKVFNSIATGIAPYAIGNGESAAEFVDRLLRGTTLEGIVNKFAPNSNNN
jgi:major vault protein